MRARLLGSGTAVPSATRGSPGVFIRGSGKGILIDPGSGTGARLARAGIDPLEVGTILVSHFHLDHVGDLAPFLFALRNPRYGEHAWPRLIGPPGIRGLYGRLRETHSNWIPEPGNEIEIIEWSGDPIEESGFRVEGFRVVHTDSSLAYRITDEEDVVLTWSGDTEVCEGIVEAAREADLLFLECSFPRGATIEGHLDPDGVSQVTRASGAHQVVLVHFYPECDEVDLMSQIDEDVRDRICLGADQSDYSATRHQ